LDIIKWIKEKQSMVRDIIKWAPPRELEERGVLI